MAKKQRKYIYISNLDYNGTVFQTQVLDWLHLFKKNNLEFDLIQTFHIKDIKRPKFIRQQLAGLRNSTRCYTGYLFLLPSKGILYFVNAFVIFCKIFKYIFQYKEILLFSRAIIGKEIGFLRRISPAEIIFFFDARAAAAEENKYSAIKKHDFSLKKYLIIANIYYLVYKTLLAADKVFVVSKVLQKYFQDTYNIADKKFVYYPCLSDAGKFYFNPDIRRELRNKLQISDQITVFVYSGGIESDWHMTESMLTFFRHLLQYRKDILLLFLTKDKISLKKSLSEFPEIETYILFFSVSNEEVYKYLNAADYGLLFRENTIMNNVASPTKFAEYMLCGLPVLISEGVGDYSDYVINNNLGILIKEDGLKNPAKFDYINFPAKSFNRINIAEIGRKNFSKDSLISKIIFELES
jgi:hypothetical protein